MKCQCFATGMAKARATYMKAIAFQKGKTFLFFFHNFHIPGNLDTAKVILLNEIINNKIVNTEIPVPE